jgi:thiol-disulfide isomerase/thioredoxin
MKHLLVSFLLWASLSLAASAGTIVIERPSFVFNTHSNVSAEKQRAVVPQKIKDAATVKDDGKPLPVPQLKPGKAVLKGTLLEYVPAINAKVNIYVNNPVTGRQEEHETKVKEDGHFELEVPLLTTMQVLLRLSSPGYDEYVLLSPGKESSIYFDLPQMSCQETPTESLKCPPAKYIYFGGANAEINNQMNDINLDGLLRRLDSDREYDTILGMTPEQYKSFTLDKTAALTAELKQKSLTRKALEFATLMVRCKSAITLISTWHSLAEAFRQSRKLDSDDPLEEFILPEVRDDFYSFLNDLSLNDPYILYYAHCSGIRYTGSGKLFFTSYFSKDIYQALIASIQLSPEELEVAVSNRNNALDNPDFPRKEAVKQNLAELVREKIDTGKLKEERLEEANRTLALCEDPATEVLTAANQVLRLNFKLYQDGVLKSEEINNSIIEALSKASDKTFSGTEMAFWEKYAQEIIRLVEIQRMKTHKSDLARILGTDRGILPDLMETPFICAKMEMFTPLTSDELKEIQQESPFFFNYLTEKNNELLAQIEANKLKGGYTVHDTPETDGERVFTEIVKPFQGKVVFVDFWNTWCGPCRSAMKEFEPSKNAFKEKGVVFIYLANESSPINTWNNMIPGIPGEHFRLKNAQMDELKKKFGFRGIPSYLILNKQGEQIYFKTGFDGGAIKKTLTEAL